MLLSAKFLPEYVLLVSLSVAHSGVPDVLTPVISWPLAHCLPLSAKFLPEYVVLVSFTAPQTGRPSALTPDIS